jgi:hypothetical protein
MKEWKQNEYFEESWRRRIQEMAARIDKDDVVADLGCGKQWLREYLPPLLNYVPVDYKERSKDTLVCDFNHYEFPNMYVDASVISGVLEYIIDVRWFASNVINHTEKRIILSYCSTETVPSTSQRKRNMWVNHYSNDDIQNFFSQSGFYLTEKWEVEANVIFVFSRRTQLKACGVVIHEDILGNLGDFTQALAARVILGEEYHAVYLHRESLNLYRGKKLPFVCNGWFSHAPVYPPCDQLTPLYISLHITPAAQKWFSAQPMVNHLNKFAPIGCRDSQTRDFLLGIGIDAYFSGCLTYALGVKLKEDWSEVIGNPTGYQQVYLIDPPVRLVKKPMVILRALAIGVRYASYVPRIWPLTINQRGFMRRLLLTAFIAYEYRKVIQQYGVNLVFETQYLKKNEQTDYEFLCSKIQDRLFTYYHGQAVITGRIHVAIPAFFSGANVVFIQREYPDIADVSRVRDHVQMFRQKVELDKPDFGERVLAIIHRDEDNKDSIEISSAELVRSQIKAVHKAVKEFYEDTDFH